MKCLSIDDNPSALAALCQLIEQVDDLQLIGEFTDAVKAFNFLGEEQVDLIFLDLEMPAIGGMEFIDNLTNPPLVIVVTAKAGYALEAFEKHVVDYLVKPVTMARFLSAVSFAKKIHESRQLKKETAETLFVKAEGLWNKVYLQDITYLKAMGDYVQIFTTTGKLLVHKTMKAMVDSLPHDPFIRVHRSYIVNIHHIENIGDNMIVIGQEVIPISERYKSSFMKQLNLL